MLTDETRKIVEVALGRPLNAEEDAGYPSLTVLPREVIAAATKIRKGNNLVAVSVYLRHVVPTATTVEVMDFIDDLVLESASGMKKQETSDEDRALLEKMRANRAKSMQRYAEQGPPRPRPDDSPIFRRWSSEEFPGGVSDTENASSDLEDLASSDAHRRAVALNGVAAAPRADELLLTACERLLADRTIAIVSLPFTYGEVRWLAAEAVAAVRGVLGRTDAVVLEDVFAPVAASKVEELARQAGVTRSGKSGVEGAIETLELIAAAGKLPRRRIKREPVPP